MQEVLQVLLRKQLPLLLLLELLLWLLQLLLDQLLVALPSAAMPNHQPPIA
jgi:hypothetical protein